MMLAEKHEYVSDGYRYLMEHPALVWVLGFRVKPDETSPYGFNMARTVPVPGICGANCVAWTCGC